MYIHVRLSIDIYLAHILDNQQKKPSVPLLFNRYVKAQVPTLKCVNNTQNTQYTKRL